MRTARPVRHTRPGRPSPRVSRSARVCAANGGAVDARAPTTSRRTPSRRRRRAPTPPRGPTRARRRSPRAAAGRRRGSSTPWARTRATACSASRRSAGSRDCTPTILTIAGAARPGWLLLALLQAQRRGLRGGRAPRAPVGRSSRSTTNATRTSARHSFRSSPRRPFETTSTPVMLRTVRRASSSAWRTASSDPVVERPMISMVLAAAISPPRGTSGRPWRRERGD